MYQLVCGFSVLLCLLTGCGSLLDINGRGSPDRSIYYDVETNQIINTNKTSINSIYFSKLKNDSTYAMERIGFAEPTDTLLIPVIKDSLAFYSFFVSMHLSGDHWRMQRHLRITPGLVQKKRKIYSRFTSH